MGPQMLCGLLEITHPGHQLRREGVQQLPRGWAHSQRRGSGARGTAAAPRSGSCYMRTRHHALQASNHPPMNIYARLARPACLAPPWHAWPGTPGPACLAPYPRAPLAQSTPCTHSLGDGNQGMPALF